MSASTTSVKENSWIVRWWTENLPAVLWTLNYYWKLIKQNNKRFIKSISVILKDFKFSIDL